MVVSPRSGLFVGQSWPIRKLQTVFLVPIPFKVLTAVPNGTISISVADFFLSFSHKQFYPAMATVLEIKLAA